MKAITMRIKALNAHVVLYQTGRMIIFKTRSVVPRWLLTALTAKR